MDKKVDEIRKKIGTIMNEEAFGELMIMLIESNTSVSDNIQQLIISINEYSVQSSKISIRLVWLTIIIALSALISSFYYIFEMVK